MFHGFESSRYSPHVICLGLFLLASSVPGIGHCDETIIIRGPRGFGAELVRSDGAPNTLRLTDCLEDDYERYAEFIANE